MLSNDTVHGRKWDFRKGSGVMERGGYYYMHTYTNTQFVLLMFSVVIPGNKFDENLDAFPLETSLFHFWINCIQFVS